MFGLSFPLPYTLPPLCNRVFPKSLNLTIKKRLYHTIVPLPLRQQETKITSLIRTKEALLCSNATKVSKKSQIQQKMLIIYFCGVQAWQ
ncbi:hypothetical protein SUGI_0576190 [Cryptomeria japonica]|nr:hypothetical protein SUGI_0576190 [Cryptomeria japonica]